jgi:hypothetical protein
MRSMAKYSNLGKFLHEQKRSAIPMTFAEVEKVIGQPLPRSARYPAWWSNNPSNNVMTRVWLEAGFKTEQVDTQAKKVVFRKVDAEMTAALSQREAQRHADRSRKELDMTRSNNISSGMNEASRPYAAAAGDSSGCRHPIYGALKGHIRIPAGLDLTEPADPEWGERVWGEETT